MPAFFVLLALAQQPGGWTAVPVNPTVGDTVWLTRTVPLAAGWRVRVGRPAVTRSSEPLGDAVILPAAGGWTVRYPVVAWTAGPVTVALPPIWRLGPDGNADSLPGGSASFTVASVIPDSVRAPAPQPALAPVSVSRRTPLPAVAAGLLSAGILVGLVALRRRAPRDLPPAPETLVGAPVADQRWLLAGEPRAVAARAIYDLRSAVARAVPAAHEALATPECLAVLEQARGAAPVGDVREVLGALDQAAFAAVPAGDVAALAARARSLAARIAT